MKMSFILILSFLTFLTHAAGSNAYMTVVGAKQGKFTGEVQRKAFEGTSLVIGTEFSTVIPRDLDGNATGRRMMKPLIVKKVWGSDSAQFHTAIADNEVLTSVRIDFLVEATPGIPSYTKTIELTNAVVADITYNTNTDENAHYDVDTITLHYKGIKVSKNGKILLEEKTRP